MVGVLQPLGEQFKVVNEDGTPTPYFIRWAQQKQIDIGESITAADALQIVIDYLADHQLQAGSGIILTPSGNITDTPTIAADVQAILDQITTTQGSILFRGATDWEALAPGTSGRFLQTSGSGADPTWAVGGGSGGKYFNGQSGNMSGVVVQSYATKGCAFQAREDLTIERIHAWIDPASLTTETYQIGFASVSAITVGTTGNGNLITAITVGSTITTSTARNPIRLTGHDFNDSLSSSVAVTAGSDFILYISRTDSTGTTAVPLSSMATLNAGPTLVPNGPVHAYPNQLLFNTTSLTNGQTPSVISADVQYAIWPEGTF